MSMLTAGQKSAITKGPDGLKAAGRKAVITKGPDGLKAAGRKAADTKWKRKQAKQDKRISELFDPIHNQFVMEGIDPIGVLYYVVMNVVLRDVTMGACEKHFDQVFNKHYGKTVDAIATMIDAAYCLKRKRRDKARKAAIAAGHTS
jgi:hypothetical protein